MAFRTVCSAGSSAAKTVACFAFALSSFCFSTCYSLASFSFFDSLFHSRDALLEVVSRGFVLLFSVVVVACCNGPICCLRADKIRQGNDRSRRFRSLGETAVI
jgi:hypothetical protein